MTKSTSEKIINQLMTDVGNLSKFDNEIIVGKLDELSSIYNKMISDLDFVVPSKVNLITFVGLPAAGKSTLIDAYQKILKDNYSVLTTGTGGIAKDPKGRYVDIYKSFHTILDQLKTVGIYYRGDLFNTIIKLDLIYLIETSNKKYIFLDTYPIDANQSKDLKELLEKSNNLFSNIYYVSRLNKKDLASISKKKDDYVKAMQDISNLIIKNNISDYESLVKLLESKQTDSSMLKLLKTELVSTYQIGFQYRLNKDNKRKEENSVYINKRLPFYLNRLSELFGNWNDITFISNTARPDQVIKELQ